MEQKYRILMGGIGDDAHSVGLRLLELGFREAGYQVLNLGIGNPISNFFNEVHRFDIVMMSCKNGHAEFFLKDFPRQLAQYRLSDSRIKLWYLGGQLSVSVSDFKIKKLFLEMGFTNVYPKPAPLANILQDVERDIYRLDLKKQHFNSEPLTSKRTKFHYRDVTDAKWSPQQLDQARGIVLTEWKTGKVILDNKHHPVPNNSSVDELLWKNKLKSGSPLLHARSGVADIEEQIEILRHLGAAGSDVASVQLDAISRAKLYSKAEEGVALSIERKESQLNGFPIPVYGVAEVRRLINSVLKPFQIRAGAPDHRFVYEIGLAAGATSLEGGFIGYTFPYDKSTSPAEALQNWQYVDRLCGLYHEQYGIRVNRECFGVLTATLIEPGLAIVVNIVESILMAQQGVTSITLGYGEQGNRAQDIAAVQALEECTLHYLELFNYSKMRITIVFHQFMAAFPEDHNKAEDLIYNSAITATMAGATKVMVKTAVEAIRIPTRFDNENAIVLCRKAISSTSSEQIPVNQIEIEKKLIKREVKLMMNAIIELGNGSISTGSLKAIEEGIIDIPFSPNVHNANRVVCVRDINGAIRFHDFGNLPLDSKIKDYHLEKIHERKSLERDPSIFSLLEKDLSRIWKGEFDRWPLDNHYVR